MSERGSERNWLGSVDWDETRSMESGLQISNVKVRSNTMKRENVKMALVETMACDLYYAQAEETKAAKAVNEESIAALKRAKVARDSTYASVYGLIEAGVRLGFEASELRAEAVALAATPHKIRPLMAEQRSDMKGKYA